MIWKSHLKDSEQHLIGRIMAKITLLHLSDLHWDEGKANDQKIVLGGLADDIAEVRKSKDLHPHLVMFSGDIVQAGDNSESFKSVKTAFVDPVLKAAGVDGTHFLMVPGNHDIQRKVVRDADFIESGLLKKFATTDDVNGFIDGLKEPNSQNNSALDRMAHYEAALRALGAPRASIANRLLTTYKFQLGGISVGVACFNTAWRATGESDDRDRRHMLIGERNVDEAISDLQNSQLRIAMYHHPFEWLAEYDDASVSSRLYSEFDVLMCGHIHRSSPEARITSVGSAVLSQCGCLYQSRKHFNGYQFLTIDTETWDVQFDIRTWIDVPRRTFVPAVNVCDDGRFSVKLKVRPNVREQNFVEPLLRELRARIRENARTHINIAEADNEIRLTVTEAFVCPPLTLRGDRPEINDAAKLVEDPVNPSEPSSDKIEVEEILRSTDNFLIVGNRESGKSSLAHYMAVLCAEGTVDRPRIPIVLDYSRLSKFNLYNLGRMTAAYFGTVKLGIDIEKILERGDFYLYVDNFSGRDTYKKADLQAFMDKYPKGRWVLFSDARFGGLDPKDDSSDLLPGFKHASIQELPRRSIRELTNRWCHLAGFDKEHTFDAVMDQLKSSSLPRTGYIVTLLLWAIYQEQRFERVNEAVLLTSMADHLLGKADFKTALLREFDPTAKEITLQSIAQFLRPKGGYAQKDEVAQFLIDFFKRKGLHHSATDVLESLIKCGILTSYEGDIGFKYRCFQEYFYAGLLRNDPQLLQDVLGDFAYVAYFRELDLLSGLRRKNSEILSHLVDDIIKFPPVMISESKSTSFQQISDAESALGIPSKQINDIRKKKLTQDQLDDLVDTTERRIADRNTAKKTLRKPVEMRTNTDMDGKLASGSSVMRPVVYMTSVDLLGRVIRNSEFNDANEKLDALKLYLNCQEKIYILYSEIISDVVDSISKGEVERFELTEMDGKAIKYMFNKAWLWVLEERVYQYLGTEKLFTTYESIVTNEESTLFERLMIAMVLLDHLHPRWSEYWDSLIDDCGKKRFILESLISKIWRLIHSRIVSEKERAKMEKIVSRIEIILGRPRAAKDTIIKFFRKQADQAEERLDE